MDQITQVTASLRENPTVNDSLGIEFLAAGGAGYGITISNPESLWLGTRNTTYGPVNGTYIAPQAENPYTAVLKLYRDDGQKVLTKVQDIGTATCTDNGAGQGPWSGVTWQIGGVPASSSYRFVAILKNSEQIKRASKSHLGTIN